MALLRLLPLLLLLSALVLLSAAPAESAGRKVGGRTDVPDVDVNKEVQDLGLFSVDEYNRRLGRGLLLTFTRVAAAQRQVVSGIKYYLRVVASADDGGADRTFDAVVVVKPWLSSRTLVSFEPARAASSPADAARRLSVR